MSSISAQQLPVPPTLKVTQKAVYVGHPDQIVKLLQSGVASAILEVKMSKNSQPVFKPKLRCKVLFEGNLPMYFLLDYPNVKIELETEAPVAYVAKLTDEDCREKAVDPERAIRYRDSLQLALTFWSIKMEEEVRKLYPDRTAEDTTRFHHSSLLSLQLNPFQKTFDFNTFIAQVQQKGSVPCFSISYGWILGSENQRTTTQPWGFKFELSPFAQSIVNSSSSSAPKSASEKQASLMKKRKIEEEAVVSVEEEK